MVVADSGNNRVTLWEFDKIRGSTDSAERPEMAVAGDIQCA
jgi:hypothetical protein